MPRVAEAECATCHQILPKTEMREVRLSRVIGRTVSERQSAASSYRHSSSFNARGQMRTGSSNSYGKGSGSRGTTRTRVERVWVYYGCKAPKSDGWLFSLFVKLIIVGAVIYVGAFYFFDRHGADNDRPRTEQVASEKHTSSGTLETPNQPTKSRKREPIVFAPRSEVVQAIPSSGSDYPACSGTVADHCVGE